ncbi:trypsin-like peptidase domain-containing protein [Kitasatospora sp. NPDC057500]|uniref:trypsin-like peptidase domain-containing protein n=1 Tax=Kitasatospora sp. NPDC057500 TaxID=3346151 RepID=UPI0036B073F9
MSAAGPDPRRVVQVRCRPAFGTGYLIGPGLVLTAAHVVAGAPGPEGGSPGGGPEALDGGSPRVTVRAPGGEAVDGTVVWRVRSEAGDAALISVPVTADAATVPGPPTRYGGFVSALPRQPVEAVGFPRLQKYGSVRDQEHFAGNASPLTGLVSGHYEVASSTPLPGPRPEEDSASWAGMSGAAVFSGGLLVGVVRSDRRARVGARLTATPVATLLSDRRFREIVRGAIGREPQCEPAELAGVLESPYPDRDIRSVASLLRAEAETVGFHGRTAEIEELAAWCRGTEPLSLRLLTGQGGQGKSRLVRRFLAEQRARGWVAGVLRRDGSAQSAAGGEPFAAVARTRRPVLVAVDYAENHLAEVRALIGQARAASCPVRVLLVTRESEALAAGHIDADPSVRELFAGAQELALPVLFAGPEERATAFEAAVRDLAAALPAVPGHEGPDWAAAAAHVAVPEATARESGSVLGVQLAALTALLERISRRAAGPDEPVERTLLRHEEAYWSAVARRHGLRLDAVALRGAVAALALVTVSGEEQACDLFTTMTGTSAGAGDRALDGARWLGELYPRGGRGGTLGAVQPDRLAEFLLIDVCAQQPDLLARIVSVASRTGNPHEIALVEAQFGPDRNSSYGQMRALVAAVLAARAQAAAGGAAGPLLDQIERTAGLPMVSAETLQWAVMNTFAASAAVSADDFTTDAEGRSVLAREVRIDAPLDPAAAALQIAGFRRGAHGMVRRDAHGEAFEHAMLAFLLSRAGREEEALEESARALARHRAVPGGREHLADHLHAHAQRLRRLGRHAEAAECLREEVELRGSTGGPPFQLSSAYEALVEALLAAGRTGHARAYAEHAAALLRPQARVPSPEQARRYARALGGQADALAADGAVDQALDCCARAEDFLDALPAATAVALAGERAALSTRWAELTVAAGRWEGVAARWRLAAEHWLRADGPYRGRDPIAQAAICLLNTSVGHGAAGEHAAAAAAAAEAVQLVEGPRGVVLRRDHPGVCEQVQVRQVASLVDADRFGEALSEAERRWSRLAPVGTRARGILADSLRHVQHAYASGGRYADALRAGRIAALVIDALEASPEGTRTDREAAERAITLTELSGCLATEGHLGEGARVAARAAAMWRRLRAVHPALTRHLTESLINQGECLRLSGRYAEAASVLAEAAATVRDAPGGGTVSRTAPGEERGPAPARAPEPRAQLVRLLDRQAWCAAQAGRVDIALNAYQELVELHRRAGDAAALASALTNLAVTSQRADDPGAGLAAATEAVALYGRLYYPDPGPHGREVARTFLVYAEGLRRSGRPADAVAPLMNALGMVRDAAHDDIAEACRSALRLASAADPEGVRAAVDRFLGT